MQIHWNSTTHDQNISHGMWFYTKTDYSYWVELAMGYGTCLGLSGTVIINVCPSGYDVTKPHAFRFWADTNGSGSLYEHFIASWTGGSDELHSYEIQRRPTNICLYDVYVDSNKVGTSAIQYCPQGYSYGYEVEVGLEHNYAAYDSDFYAENNVDSPLETWHDGAWNPWEYNYVWNGNEPCSTSHPTNCFNGTTGGAFYQWITSRDWAG